MPILHVRNVPERIYSRLQQRAETQHRSLSAEVVLLLDDALAAEETRATQADVLERLRRHRHTFRPADVGAPDSVALLREDRDR
jgi:plasmid stability protein